MLTQPRRSAPSIEVQIAPVLLTAEVQVAQQGPQGAPGLPGTGVAQTTIALAGIALSGHRVVVQMPDGRLGYDDSTLRSLRFLPPSITTGAAAAGDLVTAIVFGYLQEPSWAWIAEEPIFLGANGVLTQVVPSAGAGDAFQLQVAVAITPTTILWAPQMPIVLA